MNRGTTEKRLGRRDLKTFDDNAKKIVLAAMDQGAIGRITSNGRAFIKAPNNGPTMMVSRDTSAPNCLKNIEAEFRRLFPSQEESTTTKDESKATMIDTRYEVPFIAPNTNGNGVTNTVAQNDEMISCPAKGCDKEFVTEGAKFAHVRDNHAVCQDPGCNFGPDGTAYVGLNKSAVAGHTNVRHRMEAGPWTFRDPAKRAQAAKKTAATKAAKKAAATKATPVKSAPALTVYPTEASLTVPRKVAESKQSEHRALPTGGKTAPVTDAAKLRAIQEIIGKDPQVAFLQAANAKLQAKIDELEAQLELVAEALHIMKPAKK